MSAQRRKSVLMVIVSMAPVGMLWAQAPISYTNQIKPIFEQKCVACHACNDAPSQLDMRTAKGVERGAIKLEPYRPRLEPIPSTLVRANPNTIEQWRKLGFFSVVEGGADSIMAKLLDLGHRNPVEPNAPFTKSIELDSLRRKSFMPNASEIDGYIKAHPAEGMPLAVTGLTPEEYSLVMSWLKEGAPFDETSPKPTAKEQQKVAQWEAFLNGADNRAKLIGRYIYEHAYLFEFYFDNSGNFFHLIRSSTPPGQEPAPITTRMPNDPVEGPLYYRFTITRQTRCAKLHQLVLDASGEKLERYQRIFSETDWKVDKLPGYTPAERVDPLGVFSAIPAKARWKFLLADIWLHRGTIIWGPVCRGNLIVDSVQEQEWDFFEDPETSLYVNDAQYRDELTPYLAMPSETDNLYAFIGAIREFVERREQALTNAMSRLAKAGGSRSRLADIWRGEEPGDTPMLSIYRNGDNAFTAPPGVAVGDFPKTAWVLDLPILEHMIYSSVVNFDLFGSVTVWLGNREAFGMARRAAELNFLRFLPADQRRPIYESWYQGKLSDERRKLEKDIIDLGPDITIPTGLKFSTNDPKTEFQAMLLEHVKPFTKIADPINRPRPGDQPDRITKALQSIIAAAKEPEPAWRKFKTLLPEATFLRIDRAGQDPLVYTMTLDRDLSTKAFAVSLLQQENPSKARITIYPGALTAYPNFMFRIDEPEIEQFAARLSDADTPEKFTAVVERWGVRRSHPKFWEILHSISGEVQKPDPKRGGIFDINRYKNL